MRSRTLSSIAATAVMALGISLLVTGTGSAEPNKTLVQAQEELEALEIRAGTASEKFNEAEVLLAAATRRVEQARTKAAAAKAELDSLTAATNVIAAHAYMNGSGVDPSLALLLSNDPDGYLSRATTAQQVTRSQNATLRRSQIQRLALAQAMAALAQDEQAAKTVVAQMANHRREIEEAVASSREVVSQLREADRERLAAIAAEQREEAAASARKARQQIAQRPSRGSSSPAPESSSEGSPTGSARAAAAVRYALAQVGEPYSYSAKPPNSWDCSKLTTAAWAAGGVSLTPYSLAQAQQVRRVSVSDLRPGDLLFYFNGARHVAMYIGGGKLVEAASPENGVQVQDAWNSWSRDHFSFAGRPIG